MDQDPKTAGGADNMVASEPGQDTQFFNESTLPTAETADMTTGMTADAVGVAMAPASPFATPEMAPEAVAQPLVATPETEVSPMSAPAQPLVANPDATTAPATPVAPTSETPIARPVDSNYIQHDLRLPGDKPKRRTAIVIASIAGAVSLVLIGLAVWFFAIYSNPQKVLFDGARNILRAKNVALDGGGTVMLREKDPSSPVQSVILNFNSSSSKLPNATDVSLLITLAEEKKVNLSLGTVQMNDGVIYLKVSGIMDSLRSLGLDSETQSGMEELIKAVETIDGEWWRISVRDVLRDVSGNDQIANLYGDMYDCILRASTRDNSKEILDLLKQHPFVDVTPVKKISSPNEFNDYKAVVWHKLYEVKFKNAELASFLNALPHTQAAEEIYSCYNTAIQTYDSAMSASMGASSLTTASKTFSAEDIDEISADDIEIPEKLHLFVEAAQFGHKIRSIWAYVENDEWNNSFSAVLSYRDAVVSAPSEYRDITELFKELPIEDAWSSFSITGLGSYGASGLDDNCYDPATGMSRNCDSVVFDDTGDDFNADDYFGGDSDFLPISNEVEAI